MLVAENGSLTEAKVVSLWSLEDNFKISNPLCCPTLEILLLNPNPIEVLGRFDALKVLALTRYRHSFQWIYSLEYPIKLPRPVPMLPSLRPMLTSLRNIHTLCFRGIILGDISFLCQFKRLEILDLRGSKFDMLPNGIVDIKTLRLLDLFMCDIMKSPLEVSWLYPLSPSSQTFWVVVGSLLSSLYELFHRRLLPRFMPGKETPVTFIGLLLYFFHFQINWFRRFDDKRNFFYPIFILYISFVGMFVSVRSTHGVSLKTKLIGLLPIRGVDPLGWFFEQSLLNDFSTGDCSFL